MRLLSAVRAVARDRPDSEHDQALLRVVIVTALLGYTAWAATRHAPARPALWAINVTAVLFSVGLLARILRRPHASPRRRIAGIVHDNVAVTAWLFLCGPLGALAVFVYPFVTVGNGFRYGVRYLAFSGALGAAGIAVLVDAAPGWRSYGVIGSGVLLSHVVVTLYTGALLRRLHQAKDQLAMMAGSDVLTGLPNRRQLMERLAQAVAVDEPRQLACLYVDLDGFKAVNDRCGHQVGDRLLREVAGALRGCVRATDLLARLGGDEFTVVLSGLAAPDDASAAAQRMIEAVEAITTVDGHAVRVSASIGISLTGDPGGAGVRCAETLLKAADDAMYAVKRSGKGHYRLAERPVLAA